MNSFQQSGLSEHRAPSGHNGSTLIERARALSATLFDQAQKADASAEVAPETWTHIRQSGLGMAPFPVRHGGEDLTEPERHRDLVRVLRLLGSGDLCLARLLEGHINAVSLVCRYGSEAQIGDLARHVGEGALSAVWGAEDAVGLRAEREGGRWRLTGRKILASGAGFVTHPLVTAQTDAGQIMLLASLHPGERADITGWTAQGMRSTATGTVNLSDLAVGASQVVGVPGDFMRQPHFSGGAWRFCAAHLGAGERLVDLFRHHLVVRGRGSDPYQLQRVAQCAAAVTTAGFWITDAARLLAEPAADPQSVVAFVNLTRMVTERAMLDVLEAVHRGVGLGAFIWPQPIERISRDLSTYLRQPVPDLAMSDAARAVLAAQSPTGELWNQSVQG